MVDTRENNFSSFLSWIQNVKNLNDNHILEKFLEAYKTLSSQYDSIVHIDGEEFKTSDIKNLLKLSEKHHLIFTIFLRGFSSQQQSLKPALIEDFEFFISSTDVANSFIVQARHFETSSKETTIRRFVHSHFIFLSLRDRQSSVVWQYISIRQV